MILTNSRIVFGPREQCAHTQIIGGKLWRCGMQAGHDNGHYMYSTGVPE